MNPCGPSKNITTRVAAVRTESTGSRKSKEMESPHTQGCKKFQIQLIIFSHLSHPVFHTPVLLLFSVLYTQQTASLSPSSLGPPITRTFKTSFSFTPSTLLLPYPLSLGLVVVTAFLQVSLLRSLPHFLQASHFLQNLQRNLSSLQNQPRHFSKEISSVFQGAPLLLSLLSIPSTPTVLFYTHHVESRQVPQAPILSPTSVPRAQALASVWDSSLVST